jgi:hypothetical protein
MGRRRKKGILVAALDTGSRRRRGGLISRISFAPRRRRRMRMWRPRRPRLPRPRVRVRRGWLLGVLGIRRDGRPSVQETLRQIRAEIAALRRQIAAARLLAWLFKKPDIAMVADRMNQVASRIEEQIDSVWKRS